MGRRTELAWAAGFFDGEGSAGMWLHHNRGGKIKRIAQMAVSNTHFDSVLEFQRIVGGRGCIQEIRPRKPHHKPQLRWTGTCKTARQVARLLLPFSLIKRPVLERVAASETKEGIPCLLERRRAASRRPSCA